MITIGKNGRIWTREESRARRERTWQQVIRENRTLTSVAREQDVTVPMIRYLLWKHARQDLGWTGLDALRGVEDFRARAAALEERACETEARTEMESKMTDTHASDCAVHNAPALPVGPCDCGVDPNPEPPSIWWTDKRGVVHRCECSDVHRDVRLFWTLCGRDVPAGQAYHPREGRLTCEDCLKADGRRAWR